MIVNLLRISFLVIFGVVGLVPPAMAHHCRMQGGYTDISECDNCTDRHAAAGDCWSRITTERTVSVDCCQPPNPDQSCCSIKVRDPFTVAAAGIIVSESVSQLEQVNLQPATIPIITMPVLMPLDRLGFLSHNIRNSAPPPAHLTGSGFIS